MSFLPPRFCLNSIGQAAGSLKKRYSTYQAAEAARPVGISQKGAQDRSAEELPAGADLRRDGELAQPTVIVANWAVGVIRTAFEGKREVFREEHFRPGAERHPLVPVMLGIAVFGPLENEDRHDGEPVVRLEEEMIRYQPLFRALQPGCRVIDRGAEVARRSGSVL